MSISRTSRWAALAVLALSGTLHAEPRPVERVVARVDGSPILLSELVLWSRPRLAHLAGQPGWQRARALRLLLGDAREEAIRAALLQARARRLGVSISDAEIDATLARLAADQRVGVDELLAEAHAGGFPAAVYRAELRRQLLEQRLLWSEPYGGLGRPPSQSDAHRRWLEKRRTRLLAELGRRACIERLGRF